MPPHEKATLSLVPLIERDNCAYFFPARNSKYFAVVSVSGVREYASQFGLILCSYRIHTCITSVSVSKEDNSKTKILLLSLQEQMFYEKGNCIGRISLPFSQRLLENHAPLMTIQEQ